MGCRRVGLAPRRAIRAAGAPPGHHVHHHECGAARRLLAAGRRAASAASGSGPRDKPMIATLRHSLSTSDRPVARAVRTDPPGGVAVHAAGGVRAAWPGPRCGCSRRSAACSISSTASSSANRLSRPRAIRCGRGVRTDVFIHWIQGRGNLIVGDDVLMDGKCSFTFASRYTPTRRWRSATIRASDTAAVSSIGKRITIGRHCRIAGDVWMFDSSGHPLDAEARRAGLRGVERLTSGRSPSATTCGSAGARLSTRASRSAITA